MHHRRTLLLAERLDARGPGLVGREAVTEQLLGAPSLGTTRSNGSRETLTEMAVEVLRDQPDGIDKRTIAELIRQLHGTAVGVPSLTTQLRRLKSQGIPSREGRIWRLNGRETPRRR